MMLRCRELRATLTEVFAPMQPHCSHSAVLAYSIVIELLRVTSTDRTVLHGPLLVHALMLGYKFKSWEQ